MNRKSVEHRFFVVEWRFVERTGKEIYERSVKKEIHHSGTISAPFGRYAKTLFRFMGVSEVECLWTGRLTLSPSFSSLFLSFFPVAVAVVDVIVIVIVVVGCRHRLVDLLDKVVKTIKRHQSEREIQIEV